MLLQFIIGVLAGVLGCQVFEIAYDYYVWYTYKDNIILWDEDGE